MRKDWFKKYLSNCFLLILPIMLWNILLIDKLPDEFQTEICESDIPIFITYGENIFRVLIFVLTLIIPLKIESNIQKIGFILYIIGVLLYFTSWYLLIYFPNSEWSSNILGFMSPAYTPLLWLIGIGLIGNNFYFKLPYKKWYFLFISVMFLYFTTYIRL